MSSTTILMMMCYHVNLMIKSLCKYLPECQPDPSWYPGVTSGFLLRGCTLLAREPLLKKSAAPPSGLCLIESEGNTGEMFPSLRYPDGNELPGKQKMNRILVNNDMEH